MKINMNIFFLTFHTYKVQMMSIMLRLNFKLLFGSNENCSLQCMVFLLDIWHWGISLADAIQHALIITRPIQHLPAHSSYSYLGIYYLKETVAVTLTAKQQIFNKIKNKGWEPGSNSNFLGLLLKRGPVSNECNLQWAPPTRAPGTLPGSPGPHCPESSRARTIRAAPGPIQKSRLPGGQHLPRAVRDSLHVSLPLPSPRAYILTYMHLQRADLGNRHEAFVVQVGRFCG